MIERPISKGLHEIRANLLRRSTSPEKTGDDAESRCRQCFALVQPRCTILRRRRWNQFLCFPELVDYWSVTESAAFEQNYPLVYALKAKIMDIVFRTFLFIEEQYTLISVIQSMAFVIVMTSVFTTELVWLEDRRSLWMITLVHGPMHGVIYSFFLSTLPRFLYTDRWLHR